MIGLSIMAFLIILVATSHLLLATLQLFCRKISVPVWKQVVGNLPLTPGGEFIPIDAVINPAEFPWQLRKACGDPGFLPTGLAHTLSEPILMLPQVLMFLKEAGEDPRLWLTKHETRSFLPWTLPPEAVKSLLDRGVKSSPLTRWESAFAGRVIDFTYFLDTGRIISNDLRRRG